MARRSPLFGAQTAAHVGEVDGWSVPIDFGDVRAEYEALRRGAAILDLSFRGKLRVSGRDRATFLHSMLSNDIVVLRPGQGCHAAKLNVQGKMEAAVHVLCTPEALWCAVDPGPTARVHADLDRHLVMEDARIEDATEEWALVAVQGPGASDVLRALGVDASPLAAELQHADFEIGARRVRVVRRDHAGDGGFDVWVPAGDAEAIWKALLDSPRAKPVGLAALNLRRIERGIPWQGSEITGDFFPMEAGLEDGWISYTKGCYLGQETISRLHHLGHVNRQLRGLLVEGDAPPAPGTALHAGDKRVGQVTSAAISPTLQRPIALAYLHRDFAAPDTALQLEGETPRRPARVTNLPMA